MPGSGGGDNKNVLYIKAGAVVLGILILVVAGVLGGYSISEEKELSDMQASLNDFVDDLGTYEAINAYNEPLVNHFDVLKLSTITPETIRSDIDPGYDFIIEINDVSQYSDKHSFNEHNGKAIISGPGSYDNEVKQTTIVTLVVGQTNHAAVLTVTLRS